MFNILSKVINSTENIQEEPNSQIIADRWHEEAQKKQGRLHTRTYYKTKQRKASSYLFPVRGDHNVRVLQIQK